MHNHWYYEWALTLESREKPDPDTNELVEVYRDEREYEKYGSRFKLTKRTVRKRISGELVITYREIHNYNNQGKLLLYSKEERISGELIVTYRDSRTYDDAVRLILRIVERRINGELVEEYRETYEYNEQGKRILHEIKEWISGKLVVTHRDTYAYDNAGRCILHATEKRINGELVEVYRETYQYNEQGKCILHEVEKRISGELVLVSREIHQYTQSGKLKFHLIQRRDESSGELVDTFLEEYDYNGAGRTTYHIRKERRDNRLFTVIEEEMTYNDRGIKIFHKITINENKITINEYNNGGKTTRYEEQDIINGVPVTRLRRTYEYDNQNRMTMKQVEEKGSDGNLHKTLVLRYQYDGYSRLLRYEEENYDELGNLTTVYILDYTYDSLGRLRGLALEGKVYEDGILMGSVNISFEYNNKGQLTCYTKKVFIGDTMVSENTIEYTYNSTGIKSGQKETEIVYDEPSDSQSKKVSIYTFNNNGKISKYKQMLYDLRGGNYILVDEVITTYTYNMLGEKVRMKIIDKAFDEDGNYLGKVVQTNDYNSEGRITRIITETYDSDDNLISKETVTYEYDEYGNRIIIIEKILYDDKGEELKRTVVRGTCDEDGTLLSIIETEEYNSEDQSIANGETDEVAERLSLQQELMNQRNQQGYYPYMTEEEELQSID